MTTTICHPNERVTVAVQPSVANFIGTITLYEALLLRMDERDARDGVDLWTVI